MIPISRTVRNPDGTVNIQLYVHNDPTSNLVNYKSTPEVERMLEMIRQQLKEKPL